jgi:hypothetical protein
MLRTAASTQWPESNIAYRIIFSISGYWFIVTA